MLLPVFLLSVLYFKSILIYISRKESSLWMGIKFPLLLSCHSFLCLLLCIHGKVLLHIKHKHHLIMGACCHDDSWVCLATVMFSDVPGDTIAYWESSIQTSLRKFWYKLCDESSFKTVYLTVGVWGHDDGWICLATVMFYGVLGDTISRWTLAFSVLS